MASIHLRCCARMRSKDCLGVMSYLLLAFLLLLAQPEVIVAIQVFFYNVIDQVRS